MPIPRAVIPDGSVRPIYASGANLAAHILVKISAAGDPPRAVITGAADDAVYGATLNAITQDTIGDCQVSGRAILTVGAGGVTALDRLMPNALGKVIPLSAGAGTNVSCVGQAEVTAAENDLIEVELQIQNSRQG